MENDERDNLIGLSLSFCIKDILNKKVKVEQVKCIICGFDVPDEKTLDKVYHQYKLSYWNNFSHFEVTDLLYELWYAEKIVYLANNKYLNIASGYWSKIIEV